MTDHSSSRDPCNLIYRDLQIQECCVYHHVHHVQRRHGLPRLHPPFIVILPCSAAHCRIHRLFVPQVAVQGISPDRTWAQTGPDHPDISPISSFHLPPGDAPQFSPRNYSLIFQMAPPSKRANLAVARIIPPILLGVVVYACYAITKPLCIDYLIHPAPHHPHRSPRVGAGAAIIAVFYFLLIPVIVTYLRLLYNVAWNPGYLPRGTPCLETQNAQSSSRRSRSCSRSRSNQRKGGEEGPKTTEKTDRPEPDPESGLEYDAGGKAFPLDTTGLESFYTKDVFVCQADGRPAYCSTCCQFKTDRAHHCREVDRCVRKMDHFCPWVGGVVSETSFKFFIQFVFYTMVLCIFTLIVCALFTAELKRQTGSVNPHWIVGIALSSLFGLFGFGMTVSSLQLAMFNLTTIENLSRRSAVWTLAVRVPNHVLSKLNPNSQWAPTFRTITYPLQPTPAAPEVPQQGPPTEWHVFAILQTLPGENPFDLGSAFKNLQQVMGLSVFDWFLPLKQSPCADHSSRESAFELGPVVTRLRQEAGLEPADESNPGRKQGKHRQPT